VVSVTATHEMASADSKWRKLAVRSSAALGMLACLFSAIWLGHLAVGCLWSALTVGIFRELVNVAHKEGNADRDIPWFRSVLYAWFGVSMFAAYTMSSLSAPMRLTARLQGSLPGQAGHLLAAFLDAKHYHSLVTLWLYAGAFVWTILSLRLKHLATQLRILSFTVLALSLFVVPMKMAIHNTFAGLFWFIFPLMLVACNDTFAYFSGFALGRKVIKRPFLAISPNKTWEGFVGGGLATLCCGFLLPLALRTSPWLTCSFEAIQAAPGGVLAQCVSHAAFSHRSPLWPGSAFEAFDIQFHGLALALFASTVAPFGGFAASAIKRAYGVKDFADFIPGHGGFVDRLDCQFLMALATFVHLKTFVLVHADVYAQASASPSSGSPALDAALRLAAALGPDDRAALLHALGAAVD
jgi:phosphatidate cytidylyltransferase